MRTLRACGCRVLSLAAVGHGVADLLVARGSRFVLLEVKNGAKPPSARKLTPAQVAFHREWREHVVVVTDVDSALAALGLARAA